MPRSFILAATLLIVAVPAISQDVVFQGAGLDLDHVAVHEAPQIGAGGSVTGDMRHDRHVGAQGEVGFRYLGDNDQSRTAARLALHSYLWLNSGIAVGAYFAGWSAPSDSSTSIGGELSWQHWSGGSAELYFGETRGDELKGGGAATNRGALLGYTTANDIRGILYFHKDTTSEQGRADRDYYDYGIGVDMPVGSSGATRLSIGLGQVRFDAMNRSDMKLSLGIVRQFGGNRDRPTFSQQRSVLTNLLGH